MVSAVAGQQASSDVESRPATFRALQRFFKEPFQLFKAFPILTDDGYRMLMGAWYVEDNITLRRNLTLRIGLRHEFTNGWNEAHGDISNYYL